MKKVIILLVMLSVLLSFCGISKEEHEKLKADLDAAKVEIGMLKANLQEPVKWEYKIKAIPDLKFDEMINKLGSEGWELVFARRAQSYGEFSYEIIFKRLKQEVVKKDKKVEKEKPAKDKKKEELKETEKL